MRGVSTADTPYFCKKEVVTVADRIKGITVEIGGDTTGLNKALSGVNKKIKSTQSQLKDVERLLKMDPGNVKLLEQKQRLLSGAVEETKTKLDALKDAEKQVQQQFKDGIINQSQMDAFNREMAATQQAFDDATEKARDFGSVTAQQLQIAGEKISAVGDKVSDFGEKLLPATAAVGAVGTAAVAAFNELDEGYDTIIKKTGATGDALDGLQGSMRNVLGKLPTDAATAGIAIGEVNTRFGVTGDVLEQLSADFIRFAEINETDVNSSIDAVDAIMRKYGIDASETGSVLGLLTKAGQDTGISMDTLTNALNTNGATLKEMGLDLTGSVNLLAQFEANGVDATAALAGLKKAQQNATADGRTLGDALGETVEKIKNTADETKALQIATELFGRKGAAEMTQAIREGRVSVDDLSSSLGDYADTVQSTFEATLDPPDQAKVALNNLKIAGAELGATIMDTLAPILADLVEKVKAFAAWFTNLDDGQKQMIVTIGAVVAALGPALIAIDKVIGGVGTVVSVLGKVTGFVTGTLIPVVGAVPLAIAGVILAIAVFGDQIQAVLQAVDNFLQGVFAVDFTNVFGPVLGEALNVFFANVSNIWDAVKGVFNGIIDFVRGVFTGEWERAWNGVKEIFGGIFDGLAALVKAPLNAIIGLVNTAINGVNGVIGTLNKLPGVNIGTIGSIPYLAKGGIVAKGSAIVGEAGPELLTVANGRTVVQPLTNNTSNTANYGGVTINVYPAQGQDAESIADCVMDKIQHAVDRNGAVWA